MAIKLASSFELTGTTDPNFSRDQYATYNDLKSVTVIDDGHIAFVKETKKHYKFNGSTKQWELLTDTTLNISTAKDSQLPTAKAVKTYVEEKVSAISGVYSYKGSVETYENLPKTNVKTGDVYNVISSGMNYAAVVTTTVTTKVDNNPVTTIYDHQNYQVSNPGTIIGDDSPAFTANVISSEDPTQTINQNIPIYLIDADGDNGRHNVVLLALLNNVLCPVTSKSGNNYVVKTEGITNDFSYSYPVTSVTNTIIDWDSLGSTFNLEWH